MEDCFQTKVLFHYYTHLDVFAIELLKDSSSIL